MDLYYPPGWKHETPTPAVVFVSGYSDVGFQKIFGCKLKEMESYFSWAQLTAASGLVAVTYSTTEPASEIHAVLRYIRENAESLGIDDKKIGVWACSGNVPNALSVLMEEGRYHLKCAALCYGIMLDLDGSSDVAEAAMKWGFANPCAGKSVEDLPRELPLLVVRAGRDEMPHLNETIDRFLARALKLNLSLSFVNHAEAPHAFDVMHDSDLSREIIRQILAFLRFHLLP